MDRRLNHGSPVVFNEVAYKVGGKVVLENLSFTVPAGETLVLLGRSGSGKTTALKMVNGLLFPSSGQVLVEGKPTTEWDLIRLRRSIGYVIQDTGLFPHFTIERNVALVPRLERWPTQRAATRAHELLARVGLDPDRIPPALPPPTLRWPTSARRRGARAGGRSRHPLI